MNPIRLNRFRNRGDKYGNRTEPNRTEPNRTEIIHDLENNFQQNRLLQLKQLFPEIFCENQIDWEKLKLILGEDHLCQNGERYQLNWAGKSQAYRALQSPTFNTLIPCQDESVNFDTTQNIFIEAENLDALKILQRSYAGSVKMIYIDPPYNTGNDSFIYPDKFSETRDAYARRVSDKDTDGYLIRDGVFQGAWRKNSKESGHYHSNWLSMMLPRLHLAKTLLRDDGVIFISIDDNEQAQLKLLCDEIFGAENFVGEYLKQSKVGGGNDTKFIVKEHEFCFCYAKNIEYLQEMYIQHSQDYLKRYKEEDENGKYFWDTFARPGLQLKSEESLVYGIECPDGTILTKRWIHSKERFEQEYATGLVRITRKNNSDEWSIQFKQYLNNKGKTPRSFTMDFGGTTDGNSDLQDLFDAKYFNYPKSVKFISTLISTINDKNSLIMDFFSGSGTTAHAVMQLNAEDGGNRRFICVQLPEETDEKSEAHKAGFATIADIAKERIRRAGKQISDGLKDGQSVDTGFKVFKLHKSHFRQWQNPETRDEAGLTAQLAIFQNIVDENVPAGHLACELALRLGFQLTDPMAFSDGIVWLDNAAGTRKTALLLEHFNENLLNRCLAASPETVFALDRIFGGDDAAKTNAALQCQDAGVRFETL
ncbi:site-specific DNA-methyltransferase [Neisseria leonii]|uniref:site-specific DNA-methyltransferase n=1 Tax=Neisseria leonii TaxID=2995413 RepID=UPI00237BC0AD|nr:site-specific DNA-methyltransferase [Neisseria sp. 3986]MDD9325557.1 site-specific DNA-methyltransferase [Neisseria sp. 3986]